MLGGLPQGCSPFDLEPALPLVEKPIELVGIHPSLGQHARNVVLVARVLEGNQANLVTLIELQHMTAVIEGRIPIGSPYDFMGGQDIAQFISRHAEEALALKHASLLIRVRAFLGGGQNWSDEQAAAVLASPQGQQVAEMMTYAAVGTADEAVGYLDEFGAHAAADELITVHQTPSLDTRLRSVELLAAAAQLNPA